MSIPKDPNGPKDIEPEMMTGRHKNKGKHMVLFMGMMDLAHMLASKPRPPRKTGTGRVIGPDNRGGGRRI